MIDVIYLDMDGVLTDFDLRYQELFGTPASKVSKKNWPKFWEEFVGGENFSTLDWHTEGKELYAGVVAYAKKNNIPIEILTSAGGEEMINDIAHQKRKWLVDHKIGHRMHVVPGKRFKKNFAHDKALLIDDTPKNIVQFREAGGKAIHHTGDAKKTLEALVSENYEN